MGQALQRARRARAALIAILAAIAIGGAPRPTSAEAPAPRAAAEASYKRAEQAERGRRFAEALEAYRSATTLDPSAPFAPAARARADELAAHAEGNFEPLAKLEAVRRDPALRADRSAIEALAGELTTFPPGRVRSEARLVVAEAFRHRLGEPHRAIGLLEEILDDPAADKLIRGLALAELVALHRDQGDLKAAVLLVDRHPELARSLRAEVLRLARRETLRDVSIAIVGALIIVGIASFARAARAGRANRRRPLSELTREIIRPLAIAFALYIGGAGAILVRIYGGADVRPFLLLGLGVLGIDIIARAWRLGSDSRRPAAQAARALACAAGVLSIAFLVLERTDAGYLESFGL